MKYRGQLLVEFPLCCSQLSPTCMADFPLPFRDGLTELQASTKRAVYSV